MDQKAGVGEVEGVGDEVGVAVELGGGGGGGGLGVVVADVEDGVVGVGVWAVGEPKRW